MCQQAVTRFRMSIRETFSNTISSPVTNEYDKGSVMEISTVFENIDHIPIEASSEAALFRHLSDYVFRVRNFGNTISMRVISVSKCSIFNLDFKNAAKTEKKFNLSEIIASELVTLNCPY